MLSAFIQSELGYTAMPLVEQLLRHLFVHPGPLVLGADLLKYPTPATDKDRTVSRRSEPSSRTALMGEQPNPLLSYLIDMSVSQLSFLLPLHSIVRFLTALRKPLYASVTLLEATAPVKLPA